MLYTRHAELQERLEPTDDQPATYRFLVSTPGKKDDGLDIPVDAWDLSDYVRHPVVLLNHDLHSLPIGRAERVWTDDAGLWSDIRFSQTLPAAQQVVSLIEEGIVTATSVNFKVDDVDRSTGLVGRARIKETSIVSVPLDADVMLARSAWGADWDEEIQIHEPVSDPVAYIPINDITNMLRHLQQSLADSSIEPSDELKRLAQDTAVALRVLFADDGEKEDVQEPETIDLSHYPALMGVLNT